ncbi:hypothetical protein JD78_03148 [Modestobacter roseus]|uniref:Uncharacterized protein n=1 Tax=Modestobacter roseus TaxID=1181884 RepID=A0A562IVP2_9ACTN|nr:hypothetical protein JD78_03148 [Modestobacter roseus]
MIVRACHAGGVSADPSSRSAGRSPDRPSMPVSVKVAVGVLAALALLLLFSGVVSLALRDSIVDGFLEAQPDLERAEVDQFVLIGLVRDIAVGLLCAAAALFLPQRRRWARWAGLLGALFLGALTVVSMVTAGGLSPFTLLLVVLCAAAATSLLARTTTEWLPPVARRPG